MMKNIIFDFGCVLVRWNPDLVYLPYFNGDADAMQRFYAETNIFIANKEMDRGRAFTEMLTPLAERFPQYCEPIFYWKDKWHDMIDGIEEGSVEILTALYKQDYPLFGLTNWSAETLPVVMAQYDFFNYFRDIIVSGEVNTIKPEPEIYKILLNKHNLNPADCIFIDDSLANVQAAQDLGINVIHFKDPVQLAVELKKFKVLVD